MSTGEHNPLLNNSSEERGAFHILAMYPLLCELEGMRSRTKAVLTVNEQIWLL